MRPLEVVVLHEERRSALAVVEVSEDRARQELLPHRLPEALDLAARLWVVRAALHVGDAVSLQLLLEGGGTPPGGVLPPLVGQDLARRPVVGDRARQGLHHQRALLVMRHHEAHEVARMVVHEGRHVHALLAAQEERKEIRLPELVGFGALEAHRRGLRAGLAPRALAPARKPLLFEHPAHRRLRGTQTEEALHDVANATASRLRLLPLDRHHRFTPWIGAPRIGSRASSQPLWLQRRFASRTVLAPPFADGRVGNVQLARDFLCVDPLVDDHRSRRLHHVRRPTRPALVRARVRTAPLRLAALRIHSVRSFGAFMCGSVEGRVLGNFRHTESRIRWFAAQARASCH